MKRNCRRSEEERRIHEEAVRLRKMTDAQLVAAVSGPRQEPKPVKDNLAALLEGLGAGGCKGIKGATVYKIAEFARERGLIT